MDWSLIGSIALAVGLLILIVVLARRNMNHNYTINNQILISDKSVYVLK